jgi:aminoglycoside phosphotransferase (APT) family kinase protein
MDDADIDEALVRALLHEQHPDLAGLGLREVAGGWDNRMWRLEEELAVRLPRTPRAPSLLRTEQQWLPYLAPSLPLPVPDPVRAREPSARFPKPWTVARWVDGEPADHTPISSPRAAGTLAGFLRALHRSAPGEAPANPDRGVPPDQVGTVGLAVGLTMMIISRKHCRLRIVTLENLDYQASGTTGHRPRESPPLSLGGYSE